VSVHLPWFRKRRRNQDVLTDLDIETVSRDVLYSDDAITEWGQDILGRKELVQRLITSISGWPRQQPLVLAITAPWGTGKTSVLNLLSKELEASPGTIVIKFDPWFFNSAEGLIQGFFTVVEERLKTAPGFQLSEEGRRNWARARRVLSSLPSVSLFGFGVDFSSLASDVPSLDEVKKSVSGLCQGIEQRVVVTFDDLDRLSSEDLRTALKLVKIWTGFAPFTYILSYAREPTEAKLKKELDADPMLLQKLIQVEVSLPPAQPRSIGRWWMVL
jgi:predicted KAP-like P-loop ATPase